MQQVSNVLSRLETYVEQRDYRGYDCYDALNSPLLRLLTPGKMLKIAAIQTLKRLPINLRPLLGIPVGHNPKGLGLFLAGTVKQYRRTKDKNYLKKLEYLANLLNSLTSSGYSGPCWGYNFDWQSRVFYVPKGTPTIVNTSYVAHAFLDAYELTGNPAYLKTARGSCDFILQDLNHSHEADTLCFSYTPIDTLKVHNANMLGAGLMARVWAHTNEPALKEIAEKAVRYVLRYQKSEGSWVYAETSIQGWVDSFHTGFILESLKTYSDCTGDSSCIENIRRGYRFYLDHFFLEDGTPKYYHNQTFPVDIHSAAQAMVTTTRLCEYDAISQDIRERIAQWTLSNMLSTDGFFFFQKHKLYTNRIPYMRWSQAWMYHALTTYLLDTKGN